MIIVSSMLAPAPTRALRPTIECLIVESLTIAPWLTIVSVSLLPTTIAGGRNLGLV